MPVHNIPESFIESNTPLPDLFIYDYRMTDDVVKSKVNLSLHLFSFLQTGQKMVHFADNVAAVNEQQSILIKTGNCLMTELLNSELVYFCKLFFFSQKSLLDFLQKYELPLAPTIDGAGKDMSFFVIENDGYIHSFVQSLSSLLHLKPAFAGKLLAVKFEEILLYLLHKYGDPFLQYLTSLVQSDSLSSFQTTVENYACSNLQLAEIAFLCNMSLSTFKRHFMQSYNTPPGKWLQQKRLHKAREMLLKGQQKPADIYVDLGYNNLSNFSVAFKNEFGKSPGQFLKDSATR